MCNIWNVFCNLFVHYQLCRTQHFSKHFMFCTVISACIKSANSAPIQITYTCLCSNLPHWLPLSSIWVNDCNRLKIRNIYNLLYNPY
jgi:hypothetical protein